MKTPSKHHEQPTPSSAQPYSPKESNVWTHSHSVIDATQRLIETNQPEQISDHQFV